MLLQRLVNRTKLLLVHLGQLNTAVQHMLESDPALCAEWNAAWNELGTTVKSAGDEITRRSCHMTPLVAKGSDVDVEDLPQQCDGVINVSIENAPSGTKCVKLTTPAATPPAAGAATEHSRVSRGRQQSLTIHCKVLELN